MFGHIDGNSLVHFTCDRKVDLVNEGVELRGILFAQWGLH
jgi:hypothetical protein